MNEYQVKYEKRFIENLKHYASLKSRMKKWKNLNRYFLNVHKKAFGAMAGMVISENVAKYVYRKGFFVIAQRGDLAVILNDSKFQPATW